MGKRQAFARPARDRRRVLARLAVAAALAGAIALPGCAGFGDGAGPAAQAPADWWRDGPAYLWQAATGHLGLLWAAEPVADLIDDPATDSRLREQLVLAQVARTFAVSELALPDNGSYTRYVALEQPFVVWNVFATPPLSLQLRRSCFPVAGCVGYRGYFAREAAEAWAQRQRDAGYQTYVAGVPAYSTLGWFDDPLLSSFVNRHELELARLIFHELAHQQLYLKGDTAFNESYATAVERAGMARWVEARIAAGAAPALREVWTRHVARRDAFLALLRHHRKRLAALFAASLDDAGKRSGRDAIFDDLRADYLRLREDWGGFAGYDRWFEHGPNTAQLASVAIYDDLVPAFARLLDQHDGDFAAFHAAARELSQLPAAQRRGRLSALLAESALLTEPPAARQVQSAVAPLPPVR